MLKNLALSALLLAGAASAQCTLSVTGTGAPGTSLTLAVDGSTANAFAWVLLGQQAGTSTLSLGLFGSLTLGLAQPWAPFPLGTTNAAGDVSLVVPVPTSATIGIDLYGQGVTVGISLPTTPPTGGGGPGIGLSLCATNVVPFHVGA